MNFCHGFIKIAKEEAEQPSIRKDIGTGFLAGGALGGTTSAGAAGIITHKAFKAFKDQATKGRPHRFKARLYKTLRREGLSKGNARALTRHSGKAPLVAAGVAGLLGGALGADMGAYTGLGIGSARRVHHAWKTRGEKKK